MFYQIKQYIKFLLKSTNQHGVHSPFVYNLVTKCFYDKSNYNSYAHILNYKRALLKNKTKISITDLGVGSHVAKQKERSISEIAKNAGTTNKRAKLLYRLASYFEFKNILELGTSLGIATQAMALTNPKANIITIEGCPNISEFTKENFKNNKLEHINLINNDFNNALKSLKLNTYDLIFFDGNHQKKATLNYFETLLQTTHNNSVFIFDDIYWSKEMTEAWESIKKHPKVTVTINTFFWGFVFFRKEQVKEHFTIRV
ncbi:class I SAM-dependent methyltransferase [Sabulilitoribacter arenilitoris]|uniref:Class I SAM-dependent methyltransferase n=1 Tax=Wocania arenilitoris TaxID=2044858 RepID=A0AAE3JQ79_9FLAO|nr:class I SAM-dependent methyltransferase [Wocania arenilitoris]MCF7568945.1 class I SAM-dependent methyltransferase [Wocania arenilitoris]